MKSFLRYALVALGLCLLPVSAQAVSCAGNAYWVETSGGNFSDATAWATATGGGTNCTPTTTDNLIFDNNSGTGTATEDAAGAVTFVTIKASSTNAMSVTFASNNNSVTLTGGNFGTALSWATGTGTINTGSGTWHFTGTASGAILNVSNGLGTLSSTTFSLDIAASGGYSTQNFTPNNNTVGTVTSGVAKTAIGLNAGTYSNVTLAHQGTLLPGASITITNLSLTATSATPIIFFSGSAGTITLSNPATASWIGARSLTIGTSALTLTNSLDFGSNSGTAGGSITITPPSAGGGGHIIGG